MVSESSGIVLVTGASGYIGSHIVANLLSKGVNVRATVRDSSDPERVDHLKSLPVSEGGRLEIVEMDLLDRASVQGAVSGCESVLRSGGSTEIEEGPGEDCRSQRSVNKERTRCD